MNQPDRELIQAVLDAPRDNAPRMVLADWYAQKDDPRGEFIMAQCRLQGRGLSPAARKQLEKRVSALQSEHQAWAAPVADFAAGWRFRRGFIDKITAPADKVLSGWQQAWESEPIQYLEITEMDAQRAAELARSPLLGHITYLTIRGRIGDMGARFLAESPHLGGTESINLKDNDIGDEGVRQLAAAAGLETCKRLALTGNPIGDEGAAALAESPHVAGLDALFLSRTEIADHGVAALAASPYLGNLRTLALGSLEELTDQGAQALLDSAVLGGLKRLEVDVCYELSRNMIKALKKHWPKVRV